MTTAKDENMVNMKPIILSLLILFFLTACKQMKKEAYIEEFGEIFHTTYSIKYQYSHSLKPEIEDELARFDDSLNPFKPTSVISRVNNNEDIAVDSLFKNVFERSMYISEVSGGLFDITVAPLINAWGFGFKNMENITPTIIDSLKQITGYQKLSLKDNRIVKQDERITINTSGIAKGYSVDVIAALLESYHIENYMIEIGGEIRVKGVNAKGDCWQIGIDKPEYEENGVFRELQTVIKLCDKSVATSGNYCNFYVKDGKRYSHTIYPQTGYPTETGILSATVIADDCMSADAFATVFMLADTALTRQIAQKEKLEYMLIIAGNNETYQIVSSRNFTKFYNINE
jgi:thiamine biosynthesis lipoprotein